MVFKHVARVPFFENKVSQFTELPYSSLFALETALQFFDFRIKHSITRISTEISKLSDYKYSS